MRSVSKRVLWSYFKVLVKGTIIIAKCRHESPERKTQILSAECCVVLNEM
jgi:hypothetical protein